MHPSTTKKSLVSPLFISCVVIVIVVVAGWYVSHRKDMAAVGNNAEDTINKTPRAPASNAFTQVKVDPLAGVNKELNPFK